MGSASALRAIACGSAVLLAVGLIAGCSGTDTSEASPQSSASTLVSHDAHVAELLTLGIAQADRGEYDTAITTFEAILKFDPKSADALYNLGLVAEIRHDSEKAKSYYEKAIAADDTFTSAMYNLAILVEESTPDRAQELYEKIVVIDPEAATAFLRLSFLYQANGETDKAVAARASAIAIDPSLESITEPPEPAE